MATVYLKEGIFDEMDKERGCLCLTLCPPSSFLCVRPPRSVDIHSGLLGMLVLEHLDGCWLSNISIIASQKDEESRREEAILREIDEGKRRRGKARRLEETKYREDARMIRSVG